MTAMLAFPWPELAGAAVIVTGCVWLVWAFNAAPVPCLVVGVPFGAGIGGLVAAATNRRRGPP